MHDIGFNAGFPCMVRVR